MKSTTLGTATIEYDENGKVVEANFTTAITIGLTGIAEQLISLPCQNDTEVLKHNAEMMMAGWFSKVSDAELADQQKYEIVGEILECKKHDNGKVNKAVIKFTQRERKAA